MGKGFKAILSYESAVLPLLIYPFVKLILPIKKDSNILLKMHMHFFQILLSLILTPLVILVMLLLACYHELVTILAKSHFGNAYHDSLTGADLLFTCNTPESKSVVQIVQFLNNEPNTPEKMLQMFRDPKILDVVLRNHPRLSCIMKSLLGYTFFVKIDVDCSKIVRYFGDYTTLHEFHELAARATESDLPYGDAFMWEMLIGRTAIQVHPGKFYYPIMFRFHHTITDGMGLSTYLITSFIKNGMETYRDECERYNQIFKKYQKRAEPFTFSKFVKKCLAILNMDVYYHYDVVYSEDQPNVLGSKLTGEKQVTYSFEQQGEKLIEKIKQTKNTLQVSFTDVLLSAVSATLSEHYQLRGGTPPTEVTSISPYFSAKMDEMVSINANGEPVTHLGNKFQMCVIELPVDGKLLEKSTQMITKVNETTQDIKKSMDFALFSWILYVFLTIVPDKIVKIAATRFRSTLVITNIPGVKQLTFANNCRVEDMVVWANNFRTIGVVFSFITYGGCLRVTAHVDRGLVDNVQDVQALSDGVLRYIQVFYEQTCNTHSD